MHPQQKCAHGIVGLEEVIEDRSFQSEGLLPAVATIENRIFEVCPKREQHIIRIKNVAGQRALTRSAKIGSGKRLIGVLAFVLPQKSETHAGIQQSSE